MAGRKVVSISSNKKHLSKRDRQNRAEKEQKLKQIGRDKIRPPKWIDDVARKEFRRLVKEWESNELIANVDIAALAICCDAYSKYIQATEALANAGSLIVEIESQFTSHEAPSPYVSIAARYATIYKKFCSEFGLTPSSRLKLTLPKKEPEVDEFTKKFG